MHVYVRVCVHVCVHVWLCVFVRVSERAHMFVRVCACVFVSVDAVHVSLSYQTPITIWYDIRRYTCVHPDYV